MKKYTVALFTNHARRRFAVAREEDDSSALQDRSRERTQRGFYGAIVAMGLGMPVADRLIASLSGALQTAGYQPEEM